MSMMDTRLDGAAVGRLGLLFFALLSIAVIVVTLWSDCLKCAKIISGRSPVGVSMTAILTSDVDGNGALLGKAIHDHYPHDCVLKIARPENEKWNSYYKHFRVDRTTIAAFAYPLRVSDGEYQCFISAEDCRLLSAAASYSVKAHNAVYCLVGCHSVSTERELGLFMFRDTFVVAPMDWSRSKLMRTK